MFLLPRLLPSYEKSACLEKWDKTLFSRQIVRLIKGFQTRQSRGAAPALDLLDTYVDRDAELGPYHILLEVSKLLKRATRPRLSGAVPLPQHGRRPSNEPNHELGLQ